MFGKGAEMTGPGRAAADMAHGSAATRLLGSFVGTVALVAVTWWLIDVAMAAQIASLEQRNTPVGALALLVLIGLGATAIAAHKDGRLRVATAVLLVGLAVGLALSAPGDFDPTPAVSVAPVTILVRGSLQPAMWILAGTWAGVLIARASSRRAK